MANPSLILFDDRAAQQWEPFALTRPVGELMLGAFTMRERAERVLGIRCIAHLSGDHLAGFEEEGSPDVRPLSGAPGDGDRVFLLSRFVPAWAEMGAPDRFGGGAARLRAGNRTVGWFLPAGTAAPPPSALLEPDADSTQVSELQEISIGGTVVDHVWELVHRNPAQVAADIDALFPESDGSELPAGVYRVGDGRVVLGDGVAIEPGVVLDSSDGPIWIDDGARIQSFTRLAGPSYIGRGSAVLGGQVTAVSVGPVCKVHGELAESVCLGFTNKQHDGHMGHAYLGRWVNLGAETTNSDLKNNYGPIRMWTPRGEVDTGEIKLGCLLGDHVKTGIGLLLNTGTVVGAGSNLFGAAMPPKYVTPFSWGTGDELTEFRADKFLEVAERAMARRGQDLSEGMRNVLMGAFKKGRLDS
jgi:UDP-N-acetylglucosamine diphosphorylase / glucose-1-phosphate thymidylyltransferase / UDP-N-acetylgalactosamine diphosphorylase / glucosamine-1-phosphate N-acetyltransferase / galactosamine-1-phosphate N-acetyltransferase